MDDYLNRLFSTCLISFAALSWAVLLGAVPPANCQPLDPKTEIKELWLKSNWRQCLALCREYAANHREDTEALKIGFSCALNLQYKGEAEAIVKQLEQHPGEQETVWVFRALLAQQRGDLQEAKMYIDRVWADKARRSVPSFRLLRIQIYHALGDYQSVVDVVQPALNKKRLQSLLIGSKPSDQNEMIAGLAELLQKDCSREILWLLNGCSPERLPVEALRIWEVAARKESQTSLAVTLANYLFKDQLWQQHDAIGLVEYLIFEKDYRDALLILHQLTPPTSKTEIFFATQSEALMKLDCLTEAEETVNRGLELYPKSSKLYASRSTIRLKLSRRTEALDDLEIAIRIDPTKKENYEERISHEKGRPEPLHVISDYDRLIDLTHEPSDKLNCMLRKAAYLHATGDLTSAVKVLTLCLDYAPKDARAYKLMRKCCMELRQNDINCPDCDKFAKREGN